MRLTAFCYAIHFICKMIFDVFLHENRGVLMQDLYSLKNKRKINVFSVQFLLYIYIYDNCIMTSQEMMRKNATVKTSMNRSLTTLFPTTDLYISTQIEKPLSS